MAEYIIVDGFDEKQFQEHKEKEYNNKDELIEKYQKWVHEKRKPIIDTLKNYGKSLKPKKNTEYY